MASYLIGLLITIMAALSPYLTNLKEGGFFTQLVASYLTTATCGKAPFRIIALRLALIFLGTVFAKTIPLNITHNWTIFHVSWFDLIFVTMLLPISIVLHFYEHQRTLHDPPHKNAQFTTVLLRNPSSPGWIGTIKVRIVYEESEKFMDISQIARLLQQNMGVLCFPNPPELNNPVFPSSKHNVDIIFEPIARKWLSNSVLSFTLAMVAEINYASSPVLAWMAPVAALLSTEMTWLGKLFRLIETVTIFLVASLTQNFYLKPIICVAGVLPIGVFSLLETTGFREFLPCLQWLKDSMPNDPLDLLYP